MLPFTFSVKQFRKNHFFALIFSGLKMGKVFKSNQGGSKHGRRTFGISCEDCYAGEISRFVCNKVRFFKLDDSGNCIIRKTWLYCIWFEKKLRQNEVIPHCTRSVNFPLCLQHFDEYHAYEYSLMNKSIREVSFFTGRGLLKIGGNQVLFLDQKGGSGSKDFFKSKRGDHLYFLKK